MNVLLNSFNLADAISTANNKIISKGTNLSGIQHDNIVSLFVRRSLHRPPRYFYRFQNSLLLVNLTNDSINNYTISTKRPTEYLERILYEFYVIIIIILKIGAFEPVGR